MRRNIIADESAILGIGGEYPTGKKPEIEIGIKEILMALGVVAAAGGGLAIAKKYDFGMDDISATIAYLEAKAVGAPSIEVLDSPTPTLAPTPAPTIGANGSAKVTPWISPQEKAKQQDYGPFDEMKINTTANGTEQVTVYIQPGIKGNFTKMMGVMANRTPQFYDEIAPFLEGTTIVSTKGNNFYTLEDDMIALNDVVINLGGSDDVKKQLAGAASFYMEARGAMADKTGERGQFKNYYESELFQHSNKAKYRVAAGVDTKEDMNKWLKSNNWFEAIEGRRPTAEDIGDVDIEKYLIQ